MKQCPKCSGNLADFAEVCPYCGTTMPPTPGREQWSGSAQSSGKALASLICGVVFFLWPFSRSRRSFAGHLALADVNRSAGHLADAEWPLADW